MCVCGGGWVQKKLNKYETDQADIFKCKNFFFFFKVDVCTNRIKKNAQIEMEGLGRTESRAKPWTKTNDVFRTWRLKMADRPCVIDGCVSAAIWSAGVCAVHREELGLEKLTRFSRHV